MKVSGANDAPECGKGDRSTAEFVEHAAAKVNLSLRVLGRRSDGYHELDSLVAFASVGDRLTLHLAGPLALELVGPGAPDLATADNLVLRAANAVRARYPGLRTGTFRLEKHLPIAAGLGGGSADAAAALRLLRRANPECATDLDWPALAATIGADVTVCMDQQAARMTGVGERVTRFASFPELWAVLANPRIPLSTAAIFSALAAPPLPPKTGNAPMPRLDDISAVIDHLERHPNDLEATAIRIAPVVAEVRAALANLEGARVARMTGSGPTCFALFAEASLADRAAARLSASRTDWWVTAARLS